MDRFGVFAVWYKDVAQGNIKLGLNLIKGTEADARGTVEEYQFYAKAKGSEYSYTEISNKVCVFVRAMQDNPDADGRKVLAGFTEEEHEQLELYANLIARFPLEQ